MKQLLVAIALTLLPFFTFSSNLTVGQHLPPVTVADKGYVDLIDGEFDYRPWNSSELQNKVILIQHIAGRTSAKELNEPMMDAIKATNFPLEKYNTATLINLDEAIWGTGGLVSSEIKSNKEEYPDAIFVLDSQGEIRNKWGLNEKSSAIILLDPAGKILFAKDGKMTPAEINTVMELIKKNI